MKYEIHLTNLCNQNCIFCPVTHRPQNEPNIKKILIQLDKIKPKDVVEISGGEVLLNKNLIFLIKEIKKRSENIELSINGILLTKRKLKQLINLGIKKLKISFHTINLKNYEKITSYNNLEVLLKNLDYLKRINLNSVEIIFNLVLCKYNVNDVTKTMNYLNDNYPFAKLKISYPRFYKYSKSEFNCKKVLFPLSKLYDFDKKWKKEAFYNKIIFENIPSCVIFNDYKTIEHYLDWNTKLITEQGIIKSVDGERKFLLKCKKCRFKLNCQGFHKYYNLYFSDFIINNI